MTEEENEQRGFKVEDKRRFTGSGDARGTGDEPTKPEPVEQPNAAASGEADPGEDPPSKPTQDRSAASEGTAGGRPAVDFSSFVVGLAQQAFMLLGAAPDPEGGQAPKDLDQAAAMIDIIGMLEAKTAGNLSEDEARLVEEVLYELRMRYVAETRLAGGAPGETK